MHRFHHYLSNKILSFRPTESAPANPETKHRGSFMCCKRCASNSEHSSWELLVRSNNGLDSAHGMSSSLIEQSLKKLILSSGVSLKLGLGQKGFNSEWE
ncbi:hypothetical protein AVEN_63146-1 [Araneus ventricosus]|uniref:Uncharacterized protein n=1 Tax=Araneus ventricosus TaxID=182803 RepID=A0A4Y2B3C0_ARAVE|nr:hypothetical protein AVEN_63146-1 [Araneus ventricosus]